MKFGPATVALLTLTVGCSVLGQNGAKKPTAMHYSSAFVKDRKLVVFPFDGNAVALDLPTAVRGVTFSSDGRTMYGIGGDSVDGKSLLVAVKIKPSSISFLPGSTKFSSIYSLTVDAAGDVGVVSATYEHDGVRECGLFKLDIASGSIEHVIASVGGKCGDFLSSWSQLSISPDGSRVVGTANKGQLGIVDLANRRIEKLWSGTTALWSPDGKWIAALTFTTRMEIELIRTSDLSTQRNLGRIETSDFQWSPDSRFLLLWNAGLCGMGTGYAGTLQMLDVETGQRKPILSSNCKVDLMTIGWVSDEVLK